MHGSQFVEARRGNGIKNRAWHSQTDFKPQDLRPDSNARALLESFTAPEPPHCSKSIPHSGYLDRLPGGEFALLNVRWLLCAVRCTCFDVRYSGHLFRLGTQNMPLVFIAFSGTS